MRHRMWELPPAQLKIIVYLAFKGPACPQQIADETGIPSGTVRPSVRKLLKEGYLTEEHYGPYKSKIPFFDIILTKTTPNIIIGLETPQLIRELEEAGYPPSEIIRILKSQKLDERMGLESPETAS